VVDQAASTLDSVPSTPNEPDGVLRKAAGIVAGDRRRPAASNHHLRRNALLTIESAKPRPPLGMLLVVHSATGFALGALLAITGAFAGPRIGKHHAALQPSGQIRPRGQLSA
jgi:hypothetical protein